MFRSLLTTLGFASAPSPYKKYALLAGRWGILPLVGFLAWGNRARLKSLFSKSEQSQAGSSYSAP